MTRLLIWGAGQHGQVVAELAELCGHEVKGFVDREPSGARSIPEDDARRSLRAGEVPFSADRLVLAIGDNQVRLALMDEYAAVLAPALIHPRAWVSPSALIGPGTVVLPAAVIQTRAQVGRSVIVHVGAIVDHDAVIEDGAYLSPGSIVCGAGSVARGVQLGAGMVVGKFERFAG